VITNAGLVVGTIVGLVFLLAGILLLKRKDRPGGAMLTIGALFYLGAQLYGVIVLRPFVGRVFDDRWHQQIATVEATAVIGLLACAAGMVAHVLRHPKR
jgi:hypothetical protein